MKNRKVKKKRGRKSARGRSRQPENDSSLPQGSNIFVAVRVRPLNEKETYISNFETAKILNEQTVVLLDPQYEMAPDDVTSGLNSGFQVPQEQAEAVRLRCGLRPGHIPRKALFRDDSELGRWAAQRDERDHFCVWGDWSGEDLHVSGG